MPVYEYLCESCGPFTDMRPMSEFEMPQPCETCGATSPRVILTAPNFSCLPASTRVAHATNERSRSAPKTLAEYKASHGPGCGCCSGKKPARLMTKTKSGAKGFPTARPWMISH
jgi:putative FmdB family regulatory protein